MATPVKPGRVLSDRELQELAEQADAGFDLGAWRRRRVGRPALEPAAERPAPRIAVRVPQSLYRQVVTRANHEHRTVSAVVRELLEAYTER
jgi:dUTPase